jgi:hypothetical protein
MYLARFSYAIKPIDRERAAGVLEQEVAAARAQGLEARLLIPLTRPPGGGALLVDVVLPTLDRFGRSVRKAWAARRRPASGCVS